jgi:hypothetical protein
MTILLVAASPGVHAELETRMQPGIALLQYQHPLKAIDNIDEVKPGLLIWSFNDFPRHWKTACVLLSKEVCPCWLVSEQTLPSEEHKKAQALKIDRIFEKGFSDPALSTQLAKITDQNNSNNQPAQLFSITTRILGLEQNGIIFICTAFKANRTEIHCTIEIPDLLRLPVLSEKGCAIFVSTIGAEIPWVRVVVYVEQGYEENEIRLRILQFNHDYLAMLDAEETKRIIK